MRLHAFPLILAATLSFGALAAPATAQGVSLPSLDFPAPGTFCAPLQLCPAPLVTRDLGDD